MWLICAYYTLNTSYEDCAKKFEDSLKMFNLPYEITQISSRGDWYANMQYKPTFLKQMLEKHHPNGVVYVDVDAIFYRQPNYFDKLDQEQNVNIAVHLLDHSKYRRKDQPPELLSGTIYLKNTVKTKQIVDEWIQECKRDSKMWDQRALANVLKKHNYHLLPEEYCTIFDYMSSVKNPVIKHFQASRESRGRTNVRKKRKVRVARRVVNDGILRIRRAR